MSMQTVINPATGETIREYEEISNDEVDKTIERAHGTFLEWRRTDYGHRAELMRNAAQVLRDNADEYARVMAEEMGKPIKGGRSEVEKCAWVCEYYAENTERFLAREQIETDASNSFVTFNPLGVVLAVMPWNFPFWQVFRFAAPGLMAGNVGILKHASNVPGSALAIEDVFRKAGFPEYAFTSLIIGIPQVQHVIEHDLVRASTLTGSTRAGVAVGGQSGENIKPSVLELGGSDPYIILDDADIDKSANLCAQSRLINSGQSCIAAKRFIVMDSVYDEWIGKFIDAMSSRTLGDPFDEDTDLGPQARLDLRDGLHDQVQRSIAEGARCELGGEVPDQPGAWYPATVLTNVKRGTTAWKEELFGPVASVMRVKSERDAIEAANDSVFGLGAAVFTEDQARGERIAAEELEAGCCFVNDFVKSDPRLPFGGIKTSGYGRELSHYGIKEFVNIKTVSVA